MKSWSNKDLQFMARALELASRGLYYTRPNPMVGCVIVAEDGEIIGEGYHKACGLAHAEVSAFDSVKTQDESRLEGSTWYVTLEPCNHEGRTPACTQLILRHPPKRLVIATVDTNVLVKGRGLAVLRNAGIQVEVGCMEAEARWLNRRFFKSMEAGRPWIVLKWAQSADGFIDGRLEHERQAGSGSMKITGQEAQRLTHRWRAEEAAILIGAHTALVDDPLLDARHAQGPSPRRIVLDPNGSVHRDLRIWQTSEGQLQSKQSGTIHVTKAAEFSKSEHHCLWDEKLGLNLLLETLWKKFEINSILVEGGSATLNSFLEADLWDEIKRWTAPVQLRRGLRAPELPAYFSKPDSEMESGMAGSDRWSRFVRPSDNMS